MEPCTILGAVVGGYLNKVRITVSSRVLRPLIKLQIKHSKQLDEKLLESCQYFLLTVLVCQLACFILNNAQYLASGQHKSKHTTPHQPMSSSILLLFCVAIQN